MTVEQNHIQNTEVISVNLKPENCNDKKLIKNVDEKWATHGIFQVVGNGKITDNNPDSPRRCGKMYGFIGCVKTHLHNKTSLDGTNHKGNAYIKKRIRRCFNPRCLECYRSWAVREAKVARWRITKASVKNGRAEHIIASVPKSEYYLFEEGYAGYLKARSRVQKILRQRGIIGGALILHGFRFANMIESMIKGVPFGFYWSPHWHIIGFLVDGYSICRKCVNNCGAKRDVCRVCQKGFEGRTRRENEKDQWIVKVAKKRKSILATFFYQLEHSTIIPSKNRFHSLTWFGVCGIRALKMDKADFKEDADLCPICGSKCVPLKYLGNDMLRIKEEFWIKEFEEPAFDKDGLSIWIEKDEWDSGCYARYQCEV